MHFFQMNEHYFEHLSMNNMKNKEKYHYEDLFQWAIDAVPYYALPRYIEFRDSLPKNPQGRVLKYELRDQGCTPATWDQETSGIQVTKR